jgi:hypothetical protein
MKRDELRDTLIDEIDATFDDDGVERVERLVDELMPHIDAHVEAALKAQREPVLGRVVTRLEAAWDDGNAMGLDGWVGPGRGTEPDEHAIQQRRRLVDRLTDEVTDDA